jgi:hypothetical protein
MEFGGRPGLKRETWAPSMIDTSSNGRSLEDLGPVNGEI